MARPRKRKRHLQPITLSPAVLPVDWISVNLRVKQLSTKQANAAPTPFRGGDGRFGPFRYRKKRDLVRVWSRVDTLYDRDGLEIAEVASGPRSGLMFDEDQVIVKVENRALYDGRWGKVLDALLLGEQWGYVATSQLDVAADGHGFIEPFNDYVIGRIETTSKAKLFFQKPPNASVEGFRLGSRQAGKYARCYYKKEELAASGKQYIEDYWKAQGIATTDGMQRLEISMKGSEIRRYFGGQAREVLDLDTGELRPTAQDCFEGMDERDPKFLQHLRDPRARVAMYASASDKFIGFREKRPGARARDKAKLLWWDWSRIADEVLVVERAPRVNDIGLNALKVSIQVDYLCAKAGGGWQFLSVAQQKVAAFGLQDWYNAHTSVWDARYRKLIQTGGMNARTLFDAIRADGTSDLRLLGE